MEPMPPSSDDHPHECVSLLKKGQESVVCQQMWCTEGAEVRVSGFPVENLTIGATSVC